MKLKYIFLILILNFNSFTSNVNPETIVSQTNIVPEEIAEFDSVQSAHNRLFSETKTALKVKLANKKEKIIKFLKSVPTLKKLKSLIQNNETEIEKNYLNSLYDIGVFFDFVDGEIDRRTINSSNIKQFTEITKIRNRRLAALNDPLFRQMLNEEIQRRKKEQAGLKQSRACVIL